MTDKTVVMQNLKAGVSAYKSGNRTAAWLKMQAALREDPDNIRVLLWLAFLAETFEKRIFFFNRVLEIDPENTRAQKGLDWAKQEHAKATHSTVKTDSAPSESSPPMQLKTARQSPLAGRSAVNHSQVDDIKESIETDELQKNAKKGIIAQRARRRFRPLIAVLIFFFVAISMVIATWLATGNQVSLAELRATATDAPLMASSPDTATAVPPAETSLPPPTSIPPTATATQLPSTNTPTPPPTATQIPATDTPTAPPPTNTPIPPTTTAVSPTVTSEPGLIHQPSYPDEHWIEVDLSEQSLTAWEGFVPVMNFIVSTGLPGTPTVVGNFYVYQKLVSTRMVGDDYDLPDVPYTMYFHDGYALHGAYWHNNFGQPMSHGCVNLSLPDAEKLFYWASPALPDGDWVVKASADNPGSLVVVHY